MQTKVQQPAVITNDPEKIEEVKVQLDNRVHFKPLRAKVKNMQVRVKENSFQFNEKNFFQTHGTAMGTKMAVSFANIFMSEIETKSIQKSETKPREWKRFIDDVFSLWDCDTKEVDRFIKRANYFHPTIKFTAEMSEKQITFPNTTVF